MIVCFIFITLLTISFPAIALGEKPEKALLLDRALAAIAMKRADLSIRQDLFSSPFVLSRFKRWMETPQKAPAQAQQDARHLFETAGDPESWLRSLAGLGDIDDLAPLPLKTYRDYRLPAELPAPLRRSIRIILDAIHTANLNLAVIKSRMSPDEWRLLETYLYPEGCLSRETTKEPFEPHSSREVRKALKAAEKVDRRAILQSALIVVRAMSAAKDLLTQTTDWRKKVRSFSIKTGMGPVSIGGLGRDRHEGEKILIIDLGGDDHYEGKIASGYDGTSSLVLDLAGDDVYTGNDRTQGAGVWGIGMLLDLEGDDLYKARDCSQGTGLFGVGLLIDERGADYYLGGRYVQAASSWGLGGLLDLADEDTYRCAQSGQAYTGVAGISSLSDLGGNDKYLSGAQAPDPREPDMNQSFSQGFSMGLRNLAAGGFAILADQSGNDLYQTQYFGQGASYWMGIGLLYDERGKDVYTGRRYAQGAGIHFSLGLLLDADGNDQTVSWGVSQGCGHDYGIGILINERGDDTYASDWLSMGASEANGVGIFIDNTGNDAYAVRSGLAVGGLVPKRRAGGIGLFMDAGGRDRYAGHGSDNHIWGPNRWAIGIDREEGGISGMNILTPQSPPPVSRSLEENRMDEIIRLADALVSSENMPDLPKTEKMLSVATHWGYEKAVSREARKRLLDLDPKLSMPILVRHLDTPDIMTLIFLEEYFLIHAYHARPALIKKATVPDPLTRSRALYYLGKLKDSRALEVCIDALESPSWKVRANALRTIGEILDRRRLDILVPMKKALDDAEDKRVSPILESYLNEERSQQILSVLIRAVPLGYQTYAKYAENNGGNGREKIFKELARLVADHSIEIRSLLEKWIDDIGKSDEYSKQLTVFIHDPDPAVVRATAYALGQMNYRPAIPQLLSLLMAPHLWVRDAAVLSLARFGEEVLPALVPAMEKGSPSFKILALDVLAGIRGERSGKIIENYQQDPDEDLQRAAQQALEKQRRL